MEENNLEIIEEKNNSQKQIAGAIILAGVLIAGAILLKDSRSAPPLPNNSGQNVEEIQIKPVAPLEHILGNPNAKIVIVEYSDLECPFCKSFHNTMHRVVSDSNGQVAWVYRHFPLYQESGGRPPLHSKALKEAEATECAWEQGGNDAFWKYTDRLFEITPSNNGLDEAELPRIAEYLGLDVGAFNNCLASGKFKNKIDNEISDGIKAGVNGTPSSFILLNGKVVDIIPGAQPYEAVMQQLSQIK